MFINRRPTDDQRQQGLIICMHCGDLTQPYAPEGYGSGACAPCVNYRTERGRYGSFLFEDITRRVSGVYFAQGVKPDGRYFGLIKIGYTSMPKSRLVSLNSTHRRTIEFLGLERGSKEREQELHRRFARSRVWREWFKPSRALISYIFDNTLAVEDFIEQAALEKAAQELWNNTVWPQHRVALFTPTPSNVEQCA